MMIGDDSTHSVTMQIAALKAGDDRAAADLWERYFRRLVDLARQRLKGAPCRVADEEDVAISAFHSLCKGAGAGRFTELTNRNDLWKLLVVIVRQTAVDQVRRQMRAKRGGGAVGGESVWMAVEEAGGPRGIEQVVGEQPTPEFLCLLEEQHLDLLKSLRDDTLRQIALWRMESYTTEEIAERLKISSRSVERKLRLIRQCWQKRLVNDERA